MTNLLRCYIKNGKIVIYIMLKKSTIDDKTKKIVFNNQ